MTAEALILLNPQAAGGRAGRLAAPIEAWAKAQPQRPRLHVARSIADAQEVLRALPAGSRVAVVGGDGSLHHVLRAWREGGHVLGLCPVGTGNDTARALGVHRLHWPQALALALEGQPRRIDLAWWRAGPMGVPGVPGAPGAIGAPGASTAPPSSLRAEAPSAPAQHPFISSFAAGFDAAVAQTALRAPALLPGALRYLWATFAQLRTLQPQRIQVFCDGEPVHEGAALFASTLNTRSYGSGMPAVPQARIDDGELDLLLAGRFGRAGALAMLPLLLAGLHLHHARVRTRRFRSLRILADQPLPLAADGEPVVAAVEFEVGVWPGAVLAVCGG